MAISNAPRPLISPRALQELAPRARLLDARPGAASYAAGHLAGALHADLDAALSAAAAPGFDPARGGRHPPPEPGAWAAQLGAWGIGPDTPVVAYDGAGGGLAAARHYEWMLRAAGHEEVAVLDGGLQAAQAAGLPIQTGAPPLVPAGPPYPVSGWGHPMADLEAVARRVRDPAWKVLDVRSRERWRGEADPYETPGHIPGAVNVPYTENLGPDGRFKPPAALRSI